MESTLTPQEQLQEKYNEIEIKISEIESLNNQSYKTSGQFRYNPTSSYSNVDIHTAHSISEVIHVWAFISNKSAQYEAAAAEIGIAEYPLFKWCGYVPADWLHDIQLRIKLISKHELLTKLKAAKAEMLPYLPQENKIKQLLLNLPTF